MDEISNLFGMLLAAVVTVPAALTNSVKRKKVQQSPHEVAAVNKAQALEAPFLKMLDEHSGIIDKISHSYGYKRQDREDLYQEIVLQLWKAYPNYQGDSKISTWIYKVAVRTAILPFRRKAQVQIELREVLPETPDDIVKQEVDDRVYRVFQKLSNYDKAILALMLSGFSSKEIGVILRMRKTAIDNRMSRVRKAVEKMKS